MGETISCQNDSRVMTYTPNMSVMSANGTLKFVLVRSDPPPPAKGNDTWTIRINDASGAPVSHLTLSAVPFMPDHGHGTSVTAQVTSNGDGTYTVTPLYLFMPGVWRITLTTVADAGPSDSAIFYFCVPG